MTSVAGVTLGLPPLQEQGKAGSEDIDSSKKLNTREKVPERLLDVGIFMDVEDIFSPPELGNDDSIKELATILSQEGLRANFLFIGDRALLLRERGRQDVIDSLASHDVGLHTRSARHPTSPEYVAGKNWEEGVAESLKYEREGAEIIRTVFGKPCAALSGHSLYDSPHSMRCAAILRLPYVYPAVAAPPLYNLSWYVGALGLPENDAPTLDNQPVRSYFEFNEDKYLDTMAFDANLRRLDQHIDTCIEEGQPYLTLFLYHPQLLRLVDTIDDFWSPNGVNYPKERWGTWGRPRQRTPEQVRTSLANFRRLARWLRTDPRLNVLTVTQVAQRYGAQPTSITRQELLSAAHGIYQASDIPSPRGEYLPFNPRFSPAELVVGFARAAVSFAEQGKVPMEVPRDDVLGPSRSPIWVPESLGCTHEKLIQQSRQLLDHVSAKGQLPATLGAPLERIGVNHLYRALAESFLSMDSGSAMTEIRFRKIVPWPPLGSQIGITYLKLVEGDRVHPDTDMNTLYHDGMLQTWTLKPAIMP
jgi:hypothetical protein